MLSTKLNTLRLLAATAVLAGCASTKVPMTAEEFSSAMSTSNLKVDTLLEKGNQQDALKILDDLASHNPNRKEPWIRKAKVYFEAENYAQAIVAAEEALQRDKTDRTAKSIRAVAGLRVAAQSLNGLRDDVELKGNARADAVGLANTMRETLGEEILVPPEAKKKTTVPPAVVKPKPVAKRKTAADSGEAVPAAKNSESGGGPNPFGALR